MYYFDLRNQNSSTNYYPPSPRNAGLRKDFALKYIIIFLKELHENPCD